jgi:hypothetical protein
VVAASRSWAAVRHEVAGRLVLRRRAQDHVARGLRDTRAGELLEQSPLLIAQEWLPTEFDWRITVLDGRLLFAARYYMARGHWQIRTEEGGVERYGKVEAVPRAEAPPAVVDVALRAARLIGRGMYGVDLKETPRGPVVIEVNDNPNLDADYEDAADGDVIYEEIIDYFLRRIEEDRGRTGTRAGPAVRARRCRVRGSQGADVRRQPAATASRAAGRVAAWGAARRRATRRTARSRSPASSWSTRRWTRTSTSSHSSSRRSARSPAAAPATSSWTASASRTRSRTTSSR